MEFIIRSKFCKSWARHYHSSKIGLKLKNINLK